MAALSNPQFLGSLLKDLMPDSPRESSVLVAAAEADVPGLLRDRMAQRISTGAAIAQAAHLLEQRTALAPEACQWASRQLAELIGLPADAAAGPGAVPPPLAPDPQPWYPAQPGSQPQPPLQPQQPWAGPQPQQPWAGPPPQQPWAGPQPQQPWAGPPPQPQQPWAGPQPQQPWAGPQPGLQPPQPGLRPSPQARRGPALVAAVAALVCAVSVSGQTLVHGGLSMPYGTQTALIGLILFAAAVVALQEQTRYLGVGLIFGATLVMMQVFVLESVSSGVGGGFVAASIVTTVTALAAAVGAVACFGREIRASNMQPPLAVIYSLAAVGVVVADIPGFVQFSDGSGTWFTITGMVGSGVHGRFLFAGVVGIAAFLVAAVMAALLPPGSGVRAGVVIGWLALSVALEIGNALEVTRPLLRPAPGFWAYSALLAIALALGIALLAATRRRPAASA